LDKTAIFQPIEARSQTMSIPPEFTLAGYSYYLPPEQIAQEPAAHRDESRLLVLNRKTGDMKKGLFRELEQYLPPDCLLVVNNSKVLPARLQGNKPGGGKAEFLLLTPLPLIQTNSESNQRTAEVEGLLRSSKGFKLGGHAEFGPNLSLEVLETGEFGRCRVRLSFTGELKDLFLDSGHIPLPPYIHREDKAEDRERYQTVFAREDRLGSVAAPTAGLHFTPKLKERLTAGGRSWAEVTLYVGYGTFSPVRCPDIRDHTMHGEYIEVPEATALAVAQAKKEGRPVVAVGTTAVRALEGAHMALGEIAPFAGWTNIFIRPGHEFRVVDHMTTNFHLPESSLLIMISAFAGRERVLKAYARAVEAGFRFFSYGDAMLML
jgi:S-adenosylmethionine:tRNA ribosyltransferase-isomerase